MRLFVALSVVLVTSTSASFIVTTPLKRVQRTGAYLKGSPDADRARAAFLKSRDDYGPTSVPATNLAYAEHTTTVGIGNPPTYYSLSIDTGSSNTFCGTGIPYVQMSTSISTGETVNISYASGYFSGLEYLDQVILAPNLVITNQSIGDVPSPTCEGVDGLIGFGPVDLTQQTLSPDKYAEIPTVMNSLASQGVIKNQVLGVYLAPATNNSDANGALTYGGADPTLYKGKLTYAPTTYAHPSTYYWGIELTSSTYGNKTIVPTYTPGIVDIGTKLILLADDYFSAYMNAIPGAKWDSETGLIEIPESSVSSMHPLKFLIADREFAMDVAAQLIPEDQSVTWGGVDGKRYGVIGKLGNVGGGGLDFILGQKFIERYYAVFDTDANRVGFAETNYTFRSS